MKIRIGFVSNSSSSSYVIVGDKIKFEDILPQDIDKKNLYCLGICLDEGMDYFRLTKEFYNYILKNESKMSMDELSFYDVSIEGEGDLDISPQDFRGKTKMAIVPFTCDYHQTETLNDLKERYLHEN